MPRSRSFNEEEVLTKIMCLFWEYGYETTNLGHMEAVTALPRTSLYNAFGNKADIFALILSVYHSVVESKFDELGEEPNIESLYLLFESMLNGDEDWPTGCLMVSTASHRSAIEDRHVELVQNYRAMLVDKTRDVLKINQDLGIINKTIDVGDSAEFLVCVAWGALLTQCISKDGQCVSAALKTLKRTCDSWCQ